jgi:MFS family permease
MKEKETAVHRMFAYKWIALSNTTLGVLMATLNSSIILISLPTIFRGIHINPLVPSETGYLLWMLMGYMVVTAVLLVTFGRISDIYGRVKMYNLGFAVFTFGSILLFITPGSGNFAALEIIFFRFIQGIGGAFLFANATAILTDAFPSNQRGFAMGINQIAAIGGSFVGLLLGGILSPISWRAIFLISVPFGLLGTIWAYLMLHETATIKKGQTLDVIGNILFAVGLTLILIAITYGILPYGTATMGWSNPLVIAGLALGLAFLLTFIWYEPRIKDPLFHLQLFKIRMFTIGNIAGFLAAVARGGLQLILIIWLQGIWLPLHGVNFEETPFWAAIYMLPLSIAFLVSGPLSGYLSDRYGAKVFSTGGMLVTGIGFIGLMLLPTDFSYLAFAGWLFVIGIGMGLFAAPNTTAIMNSVPATARGVASGMIATFQNTAMTLSIGLIFSMVALGISEHMPGVFYSKLTAVGIPSYAASHIAHLPPTSALFAAFLGYNPMKTLLPYQVVANLSTHTKAVVFANSFFPTVLSQPFMDGVIVAFSISAGICFLAAIVSLFRGKRFIYEEK